MTKDIGGMNKPPCSLPKIAREKLRHMKVQEIVKSGAGDSYLIQPNRLHWLLVISKAFRPDWEVFTMLVIVTAIYSAVSRLFTPYVDVVHREYLVVWMGVSVIGAAFVIVSIIRVIYAGIETPMTKCNPVDWERLLRESPLVDRLLPLLGKASFTTDFPIQEKSRLINYASHSVRGKLGGVYGVVYFIASKVGNNEGDPGVDWKWEYVGANDHETAAKMLLRNAKMPTDMLLWPIPQESALWRDANMIVLINRLDRPGIKAELSYNRTDLLSA